MKAVIVNTKTPNLKRFPGYTAASQVLNHNKIYLENVDYTLGKPLVTEGEVYWLNFQPSHSTLSTFLLTFYLLIYLLCLT